MQQAIRSISRSAKISLPEGDDSACERPNTKAENQCCCRPKTHRRRSIIHLKTSIMVKIQEHTNDDSIWTKTSCIYFSNRCNIVITVHINGEIIVVLRPISGATLSLPCPICLWSSSFHPILHMQYKENTLYLSHNDASECPSSPQTWTLNEQENIRPTLS